MAIEDEEKEIDLDDYGDVKAQTEFLCKKIIGYSFEEAAIFLQRLHRTIRVIKRDGKNNIVTRDYKITRVNVKLENNIVVHANLG